MKLFRFGDKDNELPGVLDAQGNMRDVSTIVHDFTKETINDDGLQLLKEVDLRQLPIVKKGSRIGPFLRDVGRFYCIGLNYSDHAREADLPLPTEPIVFMKSCDVSGPNDGIVIPKGSNKTDWEVELGMVIGKAGYHISKNNATAHIAGFCVINDVSEREFQMERGGQWVKGKSCESFGPIGPYLVTQDEISNLHNLDLFLDVNGVRKQTGNTSLMIFSPAEIIAYLSRFVKLNPGDIIATGTPPGVGMGFTPPVYLKEGDTVKLGITGMGEQHHKVTRSQEKALTESPGGSS